MGSLMVKVEKLGKQYWRGLRPTVLGLNYKDLFKGLLFGSKGPLSKSLSAKDDGRELFWALQNVSFEVNKGECFGIVGRNGAGKSTLLQIIAGVRKPTRGRVEVFGQPTLLAAGGPGVGMEMTGRENIYISGSVMGATLSEIKEKFDEITAFAELERFIDTPLKFYSKGMNSRLGFSVCIHLVKEVLLLDEVIFAGDMGFRVKCIDKVKSVAGDAGRTVLVVSHSNNIIRQLCERTLLLDKGMVQAIGPSKEVTEEYDKILSAGRQPASVALPMEDSEVLAHHLPAEYQKNGAPKVPVHLQRVAIMNDSGTIANQFDVSQMVTILIEYQVTEELYGSRVGLAVKSENGIVSLTTNDTDLEPDIFKIRPAGSYQTKLTIPKRWLGPGRYRVHVLIYNEYENRVYDEVEAVGFRLKSLRAQTFMDNEVGRGVIEPVLQWHTQTDK